MAQAFTYHAPDLAGLINALCEIGVAASEGLPWHPRTVEVLEGFRGVAGKFERIFKELKESYPDQPRPLELLNQLCALKGFPMRPDERSQLARVCLKNVRALAAIQGSWVRNVHSKVHQDTLKAAGDAALGHLQRIIQDRSAQK